MPAQERIDAHQPKQLQPAGHERQIMKPTTQVQCSCQTAPKLIFPCSGASDVGGLTDRAARQMTLDLMGKMYCLAGIGGRVEGQGRGTAGVLNGVMRQT